MSDIGFDRLRAAIYEIETVPIDWLRMPFWVEMWIANAGLFTDERSLYGKWQVSALPPNTNGVWQHPEELAALFVRLSAYRPRQFVEIGCFRGWLTALAGAYFRRFNPDHTAVGIDLSTLWTVPNGIPNPGNVRYVQGDKVRVDVEWGRVVFIDGDHSYGSVKDDFSRQCDYAAMVAFHDIYDAHIRDTPGYDGGVWRLWRELKDGNAGRWTEFVRSDGVEAFGIGLIEAPSEDAP